MRKSLLNKLGKGVKKGVLIATAVASIWTASCKMPVGPDPNSPPKIISSPKTEQVERTSYNYDVVAEDADGDNLTYSLTDNHGWLSINQNTGVISGTAPEVDVDTDYPLEVKVSDGIDTCKQNYALKVKAVPPENDYLNVSGRLEDCENDGTPRQGVIKVYENNGSTNPLLGEYVMTSPGDFSFSLEKLVSELPNGVIVKARMQNGAPDSYIRTINANVNSASEPDVNAGIVRVVPYPTLAEGFSSTQFKDYMKDINFENTITKFDLDNLQGIEIMKDNHLGSTNGSFWDLENLKTRIQNNKIFGWFDGKSVPIDIEPNTTHYTFNNGEIKPDNGWIIIEPYNSTGGAQGETKYFPFGSYFSNSALIRLYSKSNTSSESPYDYTIAHEFGHASRVAPDEANKNILHYPKIVMEYISIPSNPVTPGLADLKAAKVINESTYRAEEKLDNILGTDTF